MKRLFRAAALGAVALVTIAIACGEVPTLVNGIAYLLPLELPAPAIVVGDTLRDSTGRAAPLRVRAIGRDGVEITTAPVTFLTAALPAPVSVDAAGYVVAQDTVATVQLVARVGVNLQTAPATLVVVPPPTTTAAVSPLRDSAASLPALDTLRVSVTGPYREGLTGVAGVIVRYRITVFAGRSADARAVLAADGGVVSRSDSTMAVDTTDASGMASRVLVVSGAGVDSVVVRASANSFRGIALRAVDFVLRGPR